VEVSSIVEDVSQNSLGTGNFLGGCHMGVIRERHILNALTICWNCPVLWGMLPPLFHGVLILVQGILDITWHLKVHMLVCILPL
jgi:hypothetical protein